MKITETKTRDCCHPIDDLLPYNGLSELQNGVFKPKFCKHCGQLSILETEMGPAGSNESIRTNIVLTVTMKRK